MRGAISA
jgi:hypothetical protein